MNARPSVVASRRWPNSTVVAKTAERMPQNAVTAAISQATAAAPDVVQAPDHTSIGASTAVFATVGILAAYTWKRRRTRINRWVPLGGGVALLAFLGMGGEGTDVFAHVAGFGSGCVFGLVFGVLETRALLAAWHKHTLGLAAFLFFALAWTLALLAGG